MNLLSKCLIHLFNRMTGYYWKPVKAADGTWGMYHPVLRHSWAYGMTYTDAFRECQRRNSL